MLRSALAWVCSRVPISLLNFSAINAPEKVMTEDGAWCWFQGPRAVFVRGKRMRTYAQWVTHNGRLQIGAYDHGTGGTEVHTLKQEWDRDDHNVGSFIVLPDNRLMVFYARHNKHGLFCRTASKAEDICQWDDEVTVSDDPKISYNHPVYLSEEKKFYVFWRGTSWKPTFSTSSDGHSWSEPEILIQDKGRYNASIRPYTKITGDGKSSIHFAFTDGHPRDEKLNSLYYLRYEGGNFFKADGTLVASMKTLPIPHSNSDVVYNGKATEVRAWVWDIALDDEGLPVIAYTRLPTGTDHRYCYARWTGKNWLDTEVTPGGRWFPQTPDGKKESEPHYSGGLALDPSSPSTLYVSRQVNDMFVIEKWDTPDKGRTWRSLPVTQPSMRLNVRPVVPRGYVGTPHVLWMFGDYEHFKKFKTGIKLLVPSRTEQEAQQSLRGDDLKAAPHGKH